MGTVQVLCFTTLTIAIHLPFISVLSLSLAFAGNTVFRTLPDFLANNMELWLNQCERLLVYKQEVTKKVDASSPSSDICKAISIS